MSLAVLADHMASKGRNGDTMLVHMTPGEVRGLQALALAHGGSLSINPETGLVEAGWLKRLLPAIAGMALNFIAPGVGTAIGGMLGVSGAVGTGIAIGGLTGLATGSLKQGIMAGLGAYGGASLAGGLMGAAGAEGAAGAMGVPGAATGAGSQAAILAEQSAGFGAEGLQKLAESASYAKGAAPSLVPSFTSGISNLGTEAGRKAFMTGVGGTAGLRNAALLAAAPVVADAMVPTTTQMPSGRGYQYTPRIRPMAFNPLTGELEQLPMFSAINTGGQTAGVPGVTPAQQQQQQQQEQQPGGYNTGGIVALANGGDLTKAQLGAQAIPYAQGTAATAKDIADIYYSVLGRAPDEGGLQFYQASQFSPEQIRADIMKSPEAQAFMAGPKTHAQLGAQAVPYAQGVAATENEIGNIYREMLGRSPDVGGLQFYQASKFSPEQIRAEIAKSQEYLTRPFTPEPQTMQEVRSGYEAGGGGTQMRSVNTPEPGAQVMTQNRVVDALQAYLAANPNATIGQIQAWGVANRIPAAQLAAAINERRFSQMTGASLQAYDYLMGRGAYPVNQTLSGGRPIMRPYLEAVSPTQSGGFFGRRTIPTDPSRSTAQSADNTGSTTGGTATTGGGGTTFIGGAGTNMANANTGPIGTIRNTETGDFYTPLSGTPITDYLFGTQDPSKVEVVDRSVYTDSAMRELLAAEEAMRERAAELEDVLNIEDIYKDIARDQRENDLRDEIQYQRDRIDDQQLGYNYDVGTGYYGGSIYTRNELDALAGLRSGGLADVAAAAAARGGPVERYENGGETKLKISPRFNPISSMPDADLESAYNKAVKVQDIAKQKQLKGEIDLRQRMRGAQMYAGGGGIYNLGGYSDGGRLLRGPGDGVSDSIPATIGDKQPARLADGEFVIPARIVSEIGNGSTEAGARKLYKMMDRVQRARAKTTGKGRVAKDTRADKYLPA